MYQTSQDHTLLKDIRPKMRKLVIEVIVLQQESEMIVTRDGKCIYWYLVADKSGVMVLKAWGPTGGMIKSGDVLHITGIDIKMASDRHLLEISRQGKIQRLGQDTFPFAESPNFSQPSEAPHGFSPQCSMGPSPLYTTAIDAQQQFYDPSTTIRPPPATNYITTSTMPLLQSDCGPITTTSIVNFGPGWMGGLGRNHYEQQRASSTPVLEQCQHGNHESDPLFMENYNVTSNDKENTTMNRRKVNYNELL